MKYFMEIGKELSDLLLKIIKFFEILMMGDYIKRSKFLDEGRKIVIKISKWFL